jgi:UDP-glucose 4-epimerase
MKKALVTGGAGFIGSNLVDKLIEKNWEVTVVDDLSRTGNSSYVNEKARLIVCSFENVPLEELESSNVVFHLAAKASVEESLQNPAKYFEENTTKTYGLLQKICSLNEKPSFIFSSTSAIYGDPAYLPTDEYCDLRPMSPYALSKLQVEQTLPYFAKLGLKYNILRYFNVFGNRQHYNGAYTSVISVFEKAKKEGKTLPIFGTGENSRDFISVEDVVSANILAAENPQNEIFNIGSGISYTIKEIADLISTDIQHLPKRIEPVSTQANCDKARMLLRWQPDHFLITWLKNQGVLLR